MCKQKPNRETTTTTTTTVLLLRFEMNPAAAVPCNAVVMQWNCREMESICCCWIEKCEREEKKGKTNKTSGGEGCGGSDKGALKKGLANHSSPDTVMAVTVAVAVAVSVPSPPTRPSVPKQCIVSTAVEYDVAEKRWGLCVLESHASCVKSPILATRTAFAATLLLETQVLNGHFFYLHNRREGSGWQGVGTVSHPPTRSTHGQNLGIMDDVVSLWMKTHDTI